MDIGIIFSIFENSYTRWGEKRYEKLKEHGYSCVDFSLDNTSSPLYTLPHDEAIKLLTEEKRMMDKANIYVSQVHAPSRFPPRDYLESDRRERMEQMIRSFEFTAVLGAPFWVVHPIMPFGLNDLGTKDAEETFKINVSFMKEILKSAKEYGITICVENMPFVDFSISTPKDILKLIEAVNDDNFKACLDTGHANFYDLSIKEEILGLGKHLKCVHLHDNKYCADAHAIPKFGNLNWNDIADALREINYDGVFSLEVALPQTVSDDIYETLSKVTYKIANEIIN